MSGDIILRVIKLRDENGLMGTELFDQLSLSWWNEEQRYVASLDCSDCFAWACGDDEEITEENWSTLVQTLEDFRPIWMAAQKRDRQTLDDHKEACHIAYEAYAQEHTDKGDRRWWDKFGNPAAYNAPKMDRLESDRLDTAFAELFAARCRKMRPQGASYDYYPKEVWELFDQAGPERETGFGNPYKPGEYAPAMKKTMEERFN